MNFIIVRVWIIYRVKEKKKALWICYEEGKEIKMHEIFMKDNFVFFFYFLKCRTTVGMQEVVQSRRNIIKINISFSDGKILIGGFVIFSFNFLENFTLHKIRQTSSFLFIISYSFFVFYSIFFLNKKKTIFSLEMKF